MTNHNFNEYDFVAFWISSHLSSEEQEKVLLKNPLVPCILEYEEEDIRTYGAMKSTIEELLIDLMEAEGIKCEHTWAKEGIRRREVLEEWSQKWGSLDKSLKFKFVNHKYMHSLVATHPEILSWALKQSPKLMEIHDLCWPRYDYGDTNWEEFGDETTNEDVSQKAKNFAIEPNFDEMSSEEFLYLDSDPSDLF